MKYLKNTEKLKEFNMLIQGDFRAQIHAFEDAEQ